jgi:hypothetical protein
MPFTAGSPARVSSDSSSTWSEVTCPGASRSRRHGHRRWKRLAVRRVSLEEEVDVDRALAATGEAAHRDHRSDRLTRRPADGATRF